MAKFGTVYRMKVKPDRVEDFLALNDEWDRTSKPKLPKGGGFVLFRLESDPTTFMGAAFAPSKTDYFTLADDPEQDKWYQRLRECLESDPEWNDGEIVKLDVDQD